MFTTRNASMSTKREHCRPCISVFFMQNAKKIFVVKGVKFKEVGWLKPVAISALLLKRVNPTIERRQRKTLLRKTEGVSAVSHQGDEKVRLRIGAVTTNLPMMTGGSGGQEHYKGRGYLLRLWPGA